MLTRMTEEDWATVLEVFRACRSRRGAKGRNDRIFLEAVHYFCVHTITWRALPAACGNWNSMWKRFVEALLALEPSRGVRGLLRRPRGDEPDGPLGSDVRLFVAFALGLIILKSVHTA